MKHIRTELFAALMYLSCAGGTEPQRDTAALTFGPNGPTELSTPARNVTPVPQAADSTTTPTPPPPPPAATMDAGSTATTPPPPPPPPQPRPIWVTGYYAAWNEGHLPISAVNFSALTVLAHFAQEPTTSGTLNTTANGMSADQSQRVVAAAHAAGKKVVLTVGGQNTEGAWGVAMDASHRAAFIQQVLSQVSTYGYDGVDLDVEPVADSDAANFTPFVQALRAAMDAQKPGMLLTVAAGWNQAMYSQVAPLFDQINLMTYDMAGPWQGWETWFNSPLSNGGHTFASTGQPLPSCQTRVAEATSQGAPKAKVGIGVDFTGFVWTGASGPNQSIAGVSQSNVPYWQIMDTLYSSTAYRFDTATDAPYLSIGSGSSGQFVTYDDEASIAAKVDWVRAQGLGGIILWDLSAGYRPGQPAGKQDPLMQAVKQAAFP
jgi:chitinase